MLPLFSLKKTGARLAQILQTGSSVKDKMVCKAFLSIFMTSVSPEPNIRVSPGSALAHRVHQLMLTMYDLYLSSNVRVGSL